MINEKNLLKSMSQKISLSFEIHKKGRPLNGWSFEKVFEKILFIYKF
jgi:hypothetical protein